MMRLLSSSILLLLLRLANATVDCSSASCVARLGMRFSQTVSDTQKAHISKPHTYTGDKIYPCSSTFLGMKTGYGTLGGFFVSAGRPEDEKTYYAITNAHVIAEGKTSATDHAGKYIDIEICTDDGFILGLVKAVHLRYDAAFIEIAPRVQIECNLPTPPNDMYDYGQMLFPEMVMQLPLAREECDRDHGTHSMRKSMVLKYVVFVSYPSNNTMSIEIFNSNTDTGHARVGHNHLVRGSSETRRRTYR